MPQQPTDQNDHSETAERGGLATMKDQQLADFSRAINREIQAAQTAERHAAEDARQSVEDSDAIGETIAYGALVLAFALLIVLLLTPACGAARIHCRPQTVAYYDLNPETGEIINQREVTYTVCR